MAFEVIAVAVLVVFVALLAAWDSAEPDTKTASLSGWGIVMLLIVLAAIAVPNFVKARNTSQQNACIGNLMIIRSGKEQAALAYRLTDGTTVATASANEYVKGATVPICPAGGIYTYNKVGERPECSVRTPRIHEWP